jgi:hypothetical protein
MRKLLTIVLTTVMALALGAGAVSANNGKGPPHAGIYVDDVLYRTVGTPTDFSNTGAPASSFDHIYALGTDANGDPLANVADAKPGDKDYNGGRWMVFLVTWNITPVQLTNDGQLMYYASQGWLDIGATPVAEFECPVIPIRGNSGH